MDGGQAKRLKVSIEKANAKVKATTAVLRDRRPSRTRKRQAELSTLCGGG